MSGIRKLRDELATHKRIMWALLMRELSTRYGRDNLGFLWLVAEPLVFAGAVTIMWGLIRAPFEYGLPVVPFTVCGYMSVILTRHMINHGMNCVRANSSLLYHRHVTVVHMYAARLTLEFVSVTFAAAIMFSVTYNLGLMKAPKDLPYIYLGWALLAWQSAGLALIFGSLAEVFDFMERIVGVVTYIMLPISAAFYTVDWVPARFRPILLTVPFVHPIEMIRKGEFGEYIPSHYSLAYAAASAAVMTVLGLLLLRFVRARVEIE